MSAVFILLSCAHRAPAPAPTLDGGWSSDALQAFINVEGAQSEPVVWVVAEGRRDIWMGVSPVLQPDGALSFRPPHGPGATFSLSLTDPDTLTLTLVYDSGLQESHPFSRAPPRARAELEQLQAAAVREETERQTAANVDGIRTAELAYEAAFDVFLPTGVWPRPVAELTPEAVPWPEGSDFDRLGWEPDGAVRGTFQVTVSQDGGDFTIHGWQDLDGDGVPAHWTASRSAAAALVSESGVR
jgi:hypothetical protein